MSLNGSIAAELGQVSELKWLYLHAQRSDGGIIPGALNNLAKLEQLYLYDNDLTGISSQLGSGMAQLRRFFAQRQQDYRVDTSPVWAACRGWTGCGWTRTA